MIVSLFQWLWQGRRKKGKRQPSELNAEAMAEVMKEVRYLRSEHTVDVRNLKAGEIPTIPKRADE